MRRVYLKWIWQYWWSRVYLTKICGYRCIFIFHTVHVILPPLSHLLHSLLLVFLPPKFVVVIDFFLLIHHYFVLPKQLCQAYTHKFCVVLLTTTITFHCFIVAHLLFITPNNRHTFAEKRIHCIHLHTHKQPHLLYRRAICEMPLTLCAGVCVCSRKAAATGRSQ